MSEALIEMINTVLYLVSAGLSISPMISAHKRRHVTNVSPLEKLYVDQSIGTQSPFLRHDVRSRIGNGGSEAVKAGAEVEAVA